MDRDSEIGFSSQVDMAFLHFSPILFCHFWFFFSKWSAPKVLRNFEKSSKMANNWPIDQLALTPLLNPKPYFWKPGTSLCKYENTFSACSTFKNNQICQKFGKKWRKPKYIPSTNNGMIMFGEVTRIFGTSKFDHFFHPITISSFKSCQCQDHIFTWTIKTEKFKRIFRKITYSSMLIKYSYIFIHT